jgi:hypothetical protein
MEIDMEEPMGDVHTVPVGDLRPGDKLGQDIMAGSQVLLRSGTELNDGHIKRIERLGITEVALQISSTPVLEPEPPQAEKAQAPSFRDLASGDEPSWMADEYFTRPVTPPAQLSPNEQLFAKHKQELRSSAGLIPLVDPQSEARIRKEIQAAFIGSVLKKNINLNQLGDTARSLVGALHEDPDSYLAFEDISQYGQHLAATTLLSSKVFHQLRPALANGDMGEHIRCNFALANAYALLPFSLMGGNGLDSAEQRSRLREALLRYYSWLRGQRFVSERTLELVLLQHERCDGQGVPYGLSGEMVPPESESWSLATAFSSRLHSLPKRPRLAGREAADQLIGQSGRAFSARGVNRLLIKMGYYPTGSFVELSDHGMALVVRQNEKALLKPVVRLVDQAGAAGEQVDLQQIPELFIRRQVLEY